MAERMLNVTVTHNNAAKNTKAISISVPMLNLRLPGSCRRGRGENLRAFLPMGQAPPKTSPTPAQQPGRPGP